MISRSIQSTVEQLACSFPAITITGPRQSGKSTLCRMVFAEHPYANLEQADIRRFASSDPRGFLGQYPDGAVIDEIQRCPDLLGYLQVIIDENPAPGRWILTGSQNLLLLESVSQSLAGRVGVLHLLPLGREEVLRFGAPPDSLDQQMLTGGYPAIYDRNIPPEQWYASYVSTYVERDVRTITNVGDMLAFQRFIELCAGRTGQLLNMASLAGDAGISQPTVKSWISVLETSFLTFRLSPYHANLRKRLVKMPKLHFYDTGLVCWLLGIRTARELRNHPLRGSILETWVVSEIIKRRMHQGVNRPCFYFRDQRGREADMVIDRHDRLQVVEVKAGQTVTDDVLRIASKASRLLSADRSVESFLVYGGQSSQQRTDVTVLPWSDLGGVDWANTGL